MNKKQPTYGSSLHYENSNGKEYFEWQDRHGEIQGIINARKFMSFDFSDSAILDFGAGGGELLNNLDAREKLAVEVNPHAHTKLKKAGLRHYFSIEDVNANSIDYVISHHSLEHVPYPIQALREFRRVLKQDGWLLLWIPIDDWRNQKSFHLKDINNHLHTWTPQLIGNCIVEAGFDGTKLRTAIVNHAWFPGYTYFYELPGFDLACKLFSLVSRRRQIFIMLQNS